MYKAVKRSYVEKDRKEFSSESLSILKKAAYDVYFLLNRGYKVKTATTFIGNHYLLSERQRLFLSRSISSKADLKMRAEKELSVHKLEGQTVHVDGFNTIITLEVALSGSLLLRGQDNTIRDLAGLRGTYRIIDKTVYAIHYMLKALCNCNIEKAFIYLDAPVSNSGSLKKLILELSSQYEIEIQVDIRPDVDSTLEKLTHVITTDAIILNRCISWINLNAYIIQEELEKYWLVDVVSML